MAKNSEVLDNFDMVSNYNMSFSTLLRIDIILRMLNQSTIENNILIHLRGINALFKEVYPFLNPKEKDETVKVYIQINKNLSVQDDKITFLIEDLNDLDEFELLLRVKLEAKGLLMMKGQDVNFALAGR